MMDCKQAYQELCSLILFRPAEDHPLFQLLAGLAGESGPAQRRQVSLQLRRMLEQAQQLAFQGNLWHCCLTWFLLTDENPFTLSREGRECPPDLTEQLARRELAFFRRLFDWQPKEGEAAGLPPFSQLTLTGADPTHTAGARVSQLAARLARAADDDAFFSLLTDSYARWGAGMLGVSLAFRVEGGDAPTLRPIFRPDPVRLTDLIGYEEQKNQLVRNTQAFLEGKPANNVLLYGDSGSGKSTCIRGVLQQFAGQGLRLIELYKHQFRSLADILALVKGRGCKFLLFIDDLSFEEFEVEYKALKALIEGGLEARPANLLIYATSNRRHLIRETWNDRADMEHLGDIHRSDTLEEKLSLANRFGLAINFSSPNRQQYHEMVLALARRAGVEMAEADLFRQADAWEIRHGGVSGRTAQQFINDLACK